MKHSYAFWIIAMVVIATAIGFGVVRAQQDDAAAKVEVQDSETAGQINALNDEIGEKQSDIDRLNQRIDEYRKKITALEGQATSMEVEVELLDNRVAKSEADIEETEKQISSVNDEISVLSLRIKDVEGQLERSRLSLGEILRKMDVYDQDTTLQMFFGSNSFGDLLSRLEELSSVSGDLKASLEQAQAERTQIESDRTEQVGKRASLSELQNRQKTQRDLLEEQKGTKELLLAQTQRSESQFQKFVNQLREEQQYVNQQISALQDAVERKLSSMDEEGQGSSVLSWPADPSYGISARFHDPDYPFRNLFEHPGMDIPVPYGTTIRSAAPGYVAWTRTGNMYGNYVMVIHSNGIATLYAHLSRISVVQDQFVSRGDVIGSSGGVPGTPGAGFSTGAHLHFEVRLNGIPTDPLAYLTD